MAGLLRRAAATPNQPPTGEYLSAVADLEGRIADAIAAIDAGLRRQVTATDALLDARRALKPGLGAVT